MSVVTTHMAGELQCPLSVQNMPQAATTPGVLTSASSSIDVPRGADQPDIIENELTLNCIWAELH